VYPALRNQTSVWYSDNVTGADNQQERLISLGWITGFVDGEGCFSIGLVRQPHRENRVGYRTGYQLTHEFAVTQGAKSVQCLEALKEHFGVGAVYANTRYDNHHESLYRFVVRKRADLRGVVIPFFREYRLRTAKQSDFEKFAYCVEQMEHGRHLTRAGLADLIEVVATMNRQKSRTELIRILRDHTPDPETSGEDMVPSAWRHAGRSTASASAQATMLG
jgi:LAGLIDADG DNA endonuclease family protein